MISYLQFFGKSICNRVFCILFLCFSSRIKMAMFWPHGNAGPFQLRAEKGTCRRWICHVLPPQLLYFLSHRISVPVFFAFTRSGFFSLHFLNFLTAPHLHPCPPTPPPLIRKKSICVLQNTITHDCDHDHHHPHDHHPAPPAPDEHLTK